MPVKQVALILLYKQNGEMLLQHRTDDAPVFPGHWAVFGGQIEPGETAEQAVRRECIEELAYRLDDPQLFMIHHFTLDRLEHIIYLFIEEYNGSSLTLGEGQGMGWFRVGETPALLMNQFDRMFTSSLARSLRASF